MPRTICHQDRSSTRGPRQDRNSRTQHHETHGRCFASGQYRRPRANQPWWQCTSSAASDVAYRSKCLVIRAWRLNLRTRAPFQVKNPNSHAIPLIVSGWPAWRFHHPSRAVRWMRLVHRSRVRVVSHTGLERDVEQWSCPDGFRSGREQVLA